MLRILTIPIVFCFVFHYCSAWVELTYNEMGGRITGTVVSRQTQSPLPNILVEVVGDTVRATTNAMGKYFLTNVPRGVVSIRFSSEGYFIHIQTYVQVAPGMNTQVDVQLRAVQVADTVSVEEGVFFDGPNTPDLQLTSQEVLRSPASVNDMNRSLMILPSITSVEDASNDMIIRGGAPAETGYYVDGMFMQNISHFPQLGASGGLITMLNMDFVRGIDVSVRGLPVSMGNAMSGMVEITQKNGSTDAFHGQLDLNAAGFSANLEGPINSNTTFLVSGRKSYVDALIALLDVGDAPNYSDIQGKVFHKISDRHNVAVMGLYGYSTSDRSVESSMEDNYSTFGTETYKQFAVGATITDIWSESVSSKTTINAHSTNADYVWKKIADSSVVDDASSVNLLWNFRNTNSWQVNSIVQLSSGVEVRSNVTEQNNFEVSSVVSSAFVALFADATIGTEVMGVTAGARLNLFNNSTPTSLDPRIQLWLAPSKSLVVSANLMMITQSLPTYLILGTQNGYDQTMPKCLHAGLQIAISRIPEERITLSLYSKNYSNMPMSSATPQAFLFDQVAGTQKTYPQIMNVVTSGTAVTNGLELWYQKKLTGSWMASAGVSIFSSTYRDWLGEERNRSFNNRVVGVAQITWLPSQTITVSGRYSVAGGRPYVAIDSAASAVAGSEVLDFARTNSQNLPDFHSVALRVDKRWFFESSTLTVYISIMNVLNRTNIKGYVWDAANATIKANPMWGIIPVFGVEFDF